MANNSQMRPIKRGLRPAPVPKFIQEPVQSTPKVFKTFVVPFNSVKKVRISHYENGPFLFYVQIKDLEVEFQQMTAKLQGVKLQPINEMATAVGMACLARHENQILRAAIAKFIQPDSFVVINVDFGLSATVKKGNLFHIPEDFLQFTYAIPFSLSGLKRKRSDVSEKEIGFYFRQLTENKSLTLKCLPSDGPPICQYCDLFIEDAPILEKLQDWNPHSIKFCPQNKLEIKKTHDVKVSYVDSAQEFYVHIQQPEIIAEYDATCDDLVKAMSTSSVFLNPKKGSSCAVLLSGEWYRGLVLGSRNGSIQVKIIDYGIVEEVREKQVFLLPEKLIAKPAFAFRCCLKGFENMDISDNISTQFDIFCGDGRGERKVFKMNIDSSNDLTYYVELEDLSATPTVNVNRMLLKNSRPLIETIQLENAKKRQKDFKAGEDLSSGRDRNISQRGRGNLSKGQQRNQSNTKNSKETTIVEAKDTSPSDDVKIKNLPNQEQKKIKHQCGWVSTLLSSNQAYVHFEEHISGLERILDEMFAFYENKNSRPQLKEFHVGSDCAARSSDGNWYRSRIEAVDADKVRVFHREYGNSETLHKSKLRVLDLKFAAMKDLAVSTYFAIKPQIDYKTLFNELIKIFENGAKEFSFKVLSKFRDGFILEPIDQNSGRNIIDELVRSKKALRISEKELMDIIETSQKELRESMKKIKQESGPHEASYKKLYANEISPKKSNSESDGKKPETPKKRDQISKDFIQQELSSEPEATSSNKNFAVSNPEKALLEQVGSFSSSDGLKRESGMNKKISPKKVKSPDSGKPFQTNVKLTALTSPTDFYISLSHEIPKFTKLHGDIQIIASGAAALKKFEPSTYCLAKQPFDQNWYRAQIIDSDETMVTVRCLDDGKTFSVENFQLLKIMPVELAQKKFFGRAVSLPVKVERKNEESVTEFMMKMMEDDLSAMFLNENFVELFCKSKNVVEMLVERKLAQRLEIIEQGKAYTSHIDSADSFYLQFECDQLKLDVISQYFEEAHGEFLNIPDAKPGDVVSALFPDDNCYYRSKIEEIESDGYVVTFIDYGNSCKVSKIGKISDTSVIDLPKLSKHCCLSKSPSIKRFNADADEKFRDVCASGATILDVKMVKPGDPVEVEIFVNGQNVLEVLTPLCELSE